MNHQRSEITFCCKGKWSWLSLVQRYSELQLISVIVKYELRGMLVVSDLWATIPISDSEHALHLNVIFIAIRTSLTRTL